MTLNPAASRSLETPPAAADASPHGSYDAQFQQLPTISRVEGDRFCDGCGYNLQTQAVRRDPRTAVLLCRCPECGRYHPAGDMSTSGRLWLHRAARILLIIWLVVAWTVATAFVLTQVILTMRALEMLWPILNSPTHPRAQLWPTIVAGGAGFSLLLGLSTNAFCRLCFSHWKWWSFGLAAVAFPAIATLLGWMAMTIYNTRMVDLGMPYLLGFAAANALGGLIGVAMGQRFGRTIVRHMIPHTLWPVFGYLWTDDGLDVPTRGRKG